MAYGILTILPHNTRGEYINVNQDTGDIFFCRNQHGVGFENRSSVAKVVRLRMGQGGLEPWFTKPFKKWEDWFAKAHPEQYNRLINA